MNNNPWHITLSLVILQKLSQNATAISEKLITLWFNSVCCQRGDLTFDYFDIQRISWLTRWLQGVQVLWLPNMSKSLPLHRCAWQLVRGVCAEGMFGFDQMWHCNYGQTSSPWLHVSKGNCSWSVVVCSDAAMPTSTFRENELSLGNSSKKIKNKNNYIFLMILLWNLTFNMPTV